MKKQILAATFALVAFAAGAVFAAGAGELQKFGQPVGEAKTTPIAEIAKNPAAFDGKEVTIEGKVDGVCTMAGCWMEIKEGESRLRVKVNDGEIVFPQDSIGKQAKARGWVALIEMSREQYVGWRRHEAEELGQPFDEKSIGPGPHKIVQITGLGAEISPAIDG
jgi:hypothetical protein